MKKKKSLGLLATLMTCSPSTVAHTPRWPCKDHHTELSWRKMRRPACDQGRQQPRALRPHGLQSTGLRQLALGPRGHHRPQVQLLHQPAPMQPGASEQQQGRHHMSHKCRRSADTSLPGRRAPQGSPTVRLAVGVCRLGGKHQIGCEQNTPDKTVCQLGAWHLSLAVESMRFRTISDKTSAAAPARPPDAAPSSATSIGTNLRWHAIKPVALLL